LAAAGVHGQTVRHQPDEGMGVQLNNAARVAERSGVTIVAVFAAATSRRAAMARAGAGFRRACSVRARRTA
jgi:1,6-anhydro-N-acetylmuramate kinase